MVKSVPADAGDTVRSLGQEDALEQGVATHSSAVAQRKPGSGEPGGRQSVGSQRLRRG